MPTTYTVQEIADEAGITIQAVYRNMRKIEDENPSALGFHFIKESGSKAVTETGRELLLSKLRTNPEYKKRTIKEERRNIEREVASDIVLDTLREKIEQLQEDVREKDKKIEEYKLEARESKDEMNKEREYSRRLSTELMTLASQLTELNRNNQVLLLNKQQETFSEDIIVNETVTDPTNEKKEENNNVENSSPIEEKKSFWGKIFKGK